MFTLGKGLTAGITGILFILNIAALAIIVVENKGTNVSDSAIKTAQSGIGITLVTTGLYGIWMLYKSRYPGLQESSIYNAAVGIVSSMLCLLNIIAIAIVTIQADSYNSIQIDTTAFQMALAGIIISMLVTFIYMVIILVDITEKTPSGIDRDLFEKMFRLKFGKWINN